MVSFCRGSLLEQIKYRISPSYRAKVDAQTKEAIKFLIKYPDTPCVVDGYLIPHGYGAERSLSESLPG